MHEVTRVFSDRLVSASDETAMQGIFENAVKKHFAGVDNQELFADGLLFTSFRSVHGGNDKVAETPWRVAEWAVAPRFDHPRAAVLVLVLG